LVETRQWYNVGGLKRGKIVNDVKVYLKLACLKLLQSAWLKTSVGI